MNHGELLVDPGSIFIQKKFVYEKICEFIIILLFCYFSYIRNEIQRRLHLLARKKYRIYEIYIYEIHMKNIDFLIKKLSIVKIFCNKLELILHIKCSLLIKKGGLSLYISSL